MCAELHINLHSWHDRLQCRVGVEERWILALAYRVGPLGINARCSWKIQHGSTRQLPVPHEKNVCPKKRSHRVLSLYKGTTKSLQNSSSHWFPSFLILTMCNLSTIFIISHIWFPISRICFDVLIINGSNIDSAIKIFQKQKWKIW